VDLGSFTRWRRSIRRRKHGDRAPIRVGAHFVAKELRFNAEIVERCEQGGVSDEEMKAVSLWEWRQRKQEIAGLRDDAPDLWVNLVAAYNDVDQMRFGMKPPRSADLFELADRLDQVAERK